MELLTWDIETQAANSSVTWVRHNILQVALPLIKLRDRLKSRIANSNHGECTDHRCNRFAWYLGIGFYSTSWMSFILSMHVCTVCLAPKWPWIHIISKAPSSFDILASLARWKLFSWWPAVFCWELEECPTRRLNWRNFCPATGHRKKCKNCAFLSGRYRLTGGTKSMLKLCSLGSAWIVTHSSSTTDADLQVGLPEQVETSFLCFECVAWLKKATRGLAAGSQMFMVFWETSWLLPSPRVSETLSSSTQLTEITATCVRRWYREMAWHLVEAEGSQVTWSLVQLEGPRWPTSSFFWL